MPVRLDDRADDFAARFSALVERKREEHENPPGGRDAQRSRIGIFARADTHDEGARDLWQQRLVCQPRRHLRPASPWDNVVSCGSLS